MKQLLFLIAILLSIPFFSINAQIKINEIAWMGDANSSANEWIELYNTATSDIDISGWKITAVDQTPEITLQGIILGNSYFLLERTNDDTVPQITADQIYTGALSNSGETLFFKNNASEIIETLDFQNGWPAGDNTTKQTMERTGNNWQTSKEPSGTPKAPNSETTTQEIQETQEQENSIANQPTKQTATSNNVPKIKLSLPNYLPFGENFKPSYIIDESISIKETSLNFFWNFGNGFTSKEVNPVYSYNLPGKFLVTLEISNGQEKSVDSAIIEVIPTDIQISEFLPSPEGPDQEEEFIELYNPYNFITDISGWQIDDEIDKGSKPFIFPSYTQLLPYSYNAFFRPLTKVSLNNDKDTVRLLYPNGKPAQEIFYEKAPRGWSGIWQNNNFIWTATPTPQKQNILSSEKISANIKPEKSFSVNAFNDNMKLEDPLPVIVQNTNPIEKETKSPPNKIYSLNSNKNQSSEISSKTFEQFNQANASTISASSVSASSRPLLSKIPKPLPLATLLGVTGIIAILSVKKFLFRKKQS